MNDNVFSQRDKTYNKEKGTIGFLATPNGSLLEHTPNNDKITTISKDLPSDPKDPSRQNNINPTSNPATKSIISEVIDWFKKTF